MNLNFINFSSYKAIVAVKVRSNASLIASSHSGKPCMCQITERVAYNHKSTSVKMKPYHPQYDISTTNCVHDARFVFTDTLILCSKF